jgi:hypothetical protein
MEDITKFISDLPIGLIIFAIAMLFGMFGKDDKKKQARQQPREVVKQDPYARVERPGQASTYSSDERRDRDERAMREQRAPEDVIVFGGLDFGSSGSLFRDHGNDRKESGTQWGKTKYGFDESEWGSHNQWGGNFGEKKNSDPIIR